MEPKQNLLTTRYYNKYSEYFTYISVLCVFRHPYISYECIKIRSLVILQGIEFLNVYTSADLT